MTTTDTNPGGRGSSPTTTIVAVEGVGKHFTNPQGEPLLVLDGIDLELREGEIVALLGKSGSGKSTLLRCIAGLIAPSTGRVLYRGEPLTGANPGVAMVFQSFALLPWLTVRQNVELGLEARAVPLQARHEQAERAIDLIGLDGFEAAYPKELSGGMRQRVGFARALVVEPDALLMDEPFSALDVLTAENLRNELLRLWDTPDFPTKAMLIVTHNIEEAVLLADRIFVLSSNPGRIRTEIAVDLARPRDRRSADFEAARRRHLRDHDRPRRTRHHIRRLRGGEPGALAHRGPAPQRDRRWAGRPPRDPRRPGWPRRPSRLGPRAHLRGRRPPPDRRRRSAARPRHRGPGRPRAHRRRPRVRRGRHPHQQGDLRPSGQGARPLVRAVCRSLSATKDGTLGDGLFIDLLRRGFSEAEARRQLDIAIDWGRYGELFDYDANTRQLVLEPRGRNAPAA